jgi:signal transduction histidine kinase
MTAQHQVDGWGVPGRDSAHEFRLAQTRAVLDQVPGGVLVLDGAGRVVHANGIAELRLDTPRSELVNRDLFREVLPELEAAGIGASYREGLGSGSLSLSAEIPVQTARGSVQLGIGVRPLVLDDTLWGLVLVEDRSILAAERGRRRRSERLAAVGELATGVAHEINNPLATIRGFAQLLAREADAEGGEAMEIIEAECGRIARTIHNLQEFVKRQESAERGPLDLSALVEEVVSLKRYAMETAGIELEVDLAVDPSPIVAEADAVQRVILSLLGNAEDELAETEGDRRVVVRTRESTEGVAVHVIDSGPGVPRDRLRTLLSAPAPGREDLPLGLEVAASLVREQGGQIWADSAEGRGTAFFVRFPRLDEAAAEAPLVAHVPTRPQRALRVLVADDEPALRMAISLFLTREGHEVVEAADAGRALRLAHEQPFDVALVDVRMPGDGLALLHKLDQMDSLRGRTVLMTGDSSNPRVRSHLASSRPALIKPFDMDDAVQLVEALGREG